MDCCSPTRKLRSPNAFGAVGRRARAVGRRLLPSKAVNRLKRAPCSSFQMAKKKISQCLGFRWDKESQDLSAAWNYTTHDLEELAARDLFAKTDAHRETRLDAEEQFLQTEENSADGFLDEVEDLFRKGESPLTKSDQEILPEEMQDRSYSLHVGRERLSIPTAHAFDEFAVFPIAVTFVDLSVSHGSVKPPSIWYPTMEEFSTRSAARNAIERIFRSACPAHGRFSFRCIPSYIIEEAAEVMHSVLPRPGSISRFAAFFSLSFDLKIILRVVPRVKSETPRRIRKSRLFSVFGMISPLSAMFSCFQNQSTGVSSGSSSFPEYLPRRPIRRVFELKHLSFLLALDLGRYVLKFFAFLLNFSSLCFLRERRIYIISFFLYVFSASI